MDDVRELLFYKTIRRDYSCSIKRGQKKNGRFRRANLPRDLTSGSGSNLYSLSFKASVLSATLQFSKHWWKKKLTESCWGVAEGSRTNSSSTALPGYDGSNEVRKWDLWNREDYLQPMAQKRKSSSGGGRRGGNTGSWTSFPARLSYSCVAEELSMDRYPLESLLSICFGRYMLGCFWEST